MSYRSWYDHVQGWWEKRQETRLLYLFYEDMKKMRGGCPDCPRPHLFGSLPMSTTSQDPRREVHKILQFLGKEVAERMVAKILHHTSFQEMRKNPAANYEIMPAFLMDHSLSPFLRKGGVRSAAEASLGCLAALFHGCKYFGVVRVILRLPSHLQESLGLAEPLRGGPE